MSIGGQTISEMDMSKFDGDDGSGPELHMKDNIEGTQGFVTGEKSLADTS